ncbi:MAG: mevalonate kinase [Nitrososphaeraceae archaeon]
MDISSRTQVGASAPGKVIIFGEHFVLYNNEAIVAAINRRCFGRAEPTKNLGVRIDSNLEMDSNPYTKGHATRLNVQASRKLLEPLNTFCQNILKKYAPEIGLQIHIKSELVVGAGLGSSAASCVMLAGILRTIVEGTAAKEISSIDRKWIFENALKGEQMIHNKSSGVDCYVSTYGGLVHFAGSTGSKGITSIENQPLPLFLINTRKSHETSELVSHVRRFSENRPKYFNGLARDASAICATGVRALGKGSLEEIGRLMTDNHKLLREIGVSNKEIEKIIGICLRCGALGAKITGAGGGGCILVLARPETISALNAALNGLNLCSEAIGIAKDGILIN